MSCGSRKVNKETETTKTEINGISDVKIKKESLSIGEYKKEDFNLSIKPTESAKDCETKTIKLIDKNGNKSEIPILLSSEVSLNTSSDYQRQIHQLKQEVRKKDSIIIEQDKKTNIKEVEAEKPTFWSYAITALVFFILGFVAKYKFL